MATAPPTSRKAVKKPPRPPAPAPSNLRQHANRISNAKGDAAGPSRVTVLKERVLVDGGGSGGTMSNAKAKKGTNGPRKLGGDYRRPDDHQLSRAHPLETSPIAAVRPVVQPKEYFSCVIGDIRITLTRPQLSFSTPLGRCYTVIRLDARRIIPSPPPRFTDSASASVPPLHRTPRLSQPFQPARVRLKRPDPTRSGRRVGGERVWEGGEEERWEDEEMDEFYEYVSRNQLSSGYGNEYGFWDAGGGGGDVEGGVSVDDGRDDYDSGVKIRKAELELRLRPTKFAAKDERKGRSFSNSYRDMIDTQRQGRQEQTGYPCLRSMQTRSTVLGDSEQQQKRRTKPKAVFQSTIPLTSEIGKLTASGNLRPDCDSLTWTISQDDFVDEDEVEEAEVGCSGGVEGKSTHLPKHFTLAIYVDHPSVTEFVILGRVKFDVVGTGGCWDRLREFVKGRILGCYRRRFEIGFVRKGLKAKRGVIEGPFNPRFFWGRTNMEVLKDQRGFGNELSSYPSFRPSLPVLPPSFPVRSGPVRDLSLWPDRLRL